MTAPLLNTIIEAFALPPEARIDRRIPKTTLADQAPTPALKKLVRDTVARLDWIAELSPASIAVPARDDPPAPAINILVLTPGKPATQRLWDMIHRLIPAPVVLLTARADGGVTMTLAPLRRAERIDGVVVEHLVVAPNLTSPLDRDGGAFAASLAIAGLPHTDLGMLYDALIIRAEALEAARAATTLFRLPDNAGEAIERRERLTAWRYAQAAWEIARTTARRERRLAQAVQLGEQARLLKAQVDVAAAALA
jgi:hypothetical protein